MKKYKVTLKAYSLFPLNNLRMSDGSLLEDGVVSLDENLPCIARFIRLGVLEEVINSPPVVEKVKRTRRKPSAAPTLDIKEETEE